MLGLFLFVFRFVRLLFSGHEAIALENAALRMQIAAFQRKRKCPLLTAWDRVFWITLRSLWSEWRHPLIYVQADTVVRWHRERFRKFWARLSKPQRRRPGRPGTAAELRRLIERMAAANPLWRAPVAPGMNSVQRRVSSFMWPAIRFLTLNLARAISGANVTTGQPVSG